MSLEELIDRVDVTADEILAAAADPREVLAVGAKVFVMFEAASDKLREAVADSEASLERCKATTDIDSFDARHVEQVEAACHAEACLEAAQAAWQRYLPWKEASERIDAALRLMQIVESN